jgi:hypothetical protein
MIDRLRTKFYTAYRRRYGRVMIADPRPMARENPYTFQLPTAEEIAHLAPGHSVKLIFRSLPEGADYAAERMWVTITHRDGEKFLGDLDNEPLDIPQLSPGDEVSFAAHQIIGVFWADAADRARFEDPESDRWFARAEVDPRITRDGAPVRYIRREPPVDSDGDNPDTGWRILSEPEGDWRAMETTPCAIGLVLNRDDSILPYLDAPVGSAFRRTDDQESFAPAARLH